MKKRILAMLMCLALALSMMPSAAFAVETSAEAHVTITIDSVEDFTQFAVAVTTNAEYKGVAVANNKNIYVQLTTSLDLEGVLWGQNTAGPNAIGNGGGNAFCGTFDGKNNTISNHTVTGNWNYYRALFRTVGDGFTIKNITFDGSKSTSGLADPTTQKTRNVGVIVGAIGSGNITFENVVVKNAEIDASYSAAVLVGSANGGVINVKDCTIDNVEIISGEKTGTYVSDVDSTYTTSGVNVLGANTITDVTWTDKTGADRTEELVGYRMDGIRYSADGKQLDVAVIGKTAYASLQEAIAAAQADDTITLADGTHTLSGSIANKNITIKGSEGAVIEMLTAINASGSTIAFDGVTVKFDNDNYEGLQHSVKVTYNDCTHIGTQFLYAPTVEFTGCTFEMYDAKTEYAVWTYGAKDVIFTDCVFNTNGKAVLVYTEAAHQATIALSGCEFNSNGTYTGKAAVEIGASANGAVSDYDLSFTECEADENFTANNTDSNLWGNKDSVTTESGSSVKIDNDVNVMPAPAPTAELVDRSYDLSLNAEIHFNQYVGIDIEGYDRAYIEANGGLLVWTANPGADATINSASAEKIEGLTYGGTYGDGKHEYWAQTGGVASKEYADEYYMCIYLQLKDGSYIYTNVRERSVQMYCEDILSMDASTNERLVTLQPLCRNMLEYGASAQLHFGYNVEDLANANIKKEGE